MKKNMKSMHIGLIIGCILMGLGSISLLASIIYDYIIFGEFKKQYLGMALIPLMGITLILFTANVSPKK